LILVPPFLRGARGVFHASTTPENLKVILVMLLDTLDPPKSPLRRGTLILIPPFLRGARGDLLCTHNSRKFIRVEGLQLEDSEVEA
jgi:hypothetical protein